MSKIVKDGSQEYEGELTCHVCKTVFKVDTSDLGVGGFKEKPNTYWFDGSATSVDKYYAWCPHGCDLIFIPDDDIPVLAQRKAVRGR
jgi:uncharacterized protein YbaR (Trm112 family)